jgi:hypothetical protein
MAERDESLAVKVGTVALTIVAGWLARKLVAAIWARATGRAAPEDPDDEDVTIIQAVAFAAVTGGIAVLARRLAHRGAAKALAGRSHSTLGNR